MSTGNQSCFITAIMLDSIDKVNVDLLPSNPWYKPGSLIKERVITVNLTKL